MDGHDGYILVSSARRRCREQARFPEASEKYNAKAPPSPATAPPRPLSLPVEILADWKVPKPREASAAYHDWATGEDLRISEWDSLQYFEMYHFDLAKLPVAFGPSVGDEGVIFATKKPRYWRVSCLGLHVKTHQTKSEADKKLRKSLNKNKQREQDIRDELGFGASL